MQRKNRHQPKQEARAHLEEHAAAGLKIACSDVIFLNHEACDFLLAQDADVTSAVETRKRRKQLKGMHRRVHRAGRQPYWNGARPTGEGPLDTTGGEATFVKKNVVSRSLARCDSYPQELTSLRGLLGDSAPFARVHVRVHSDMHAGRLGL